MSALDPARVAEVFDRAVDLETSDRADFLEEACGTDADLRREVEDLLAFDREPATAPEPTAPLAGTAHAATVPAGDSTKTPAPSKERRIGRFEVADKLGEGGMGVVYEGRDPTLGRAVALKLVSSSGGHEGRTRLLREAQAMARVAHPNVVPVYEVGLHAESVFVAMELVKGETLASWLKTRPRSWREALEKLVQAGRGLAAAHAAGVLHRDFKPENVLLGEDGRARVLDFGLARALDAPGTDDPAKSPAEVALLDVNMTREGAVMGTPSYMSPEHFGGAIGPWSDQWSFAVSAYRAVFGELPFRGKNLSELRERILEGEAEAPRREGLPSEVGEIVLRGMKRYPEDRWPSVSAMTDALERILAADPDTDRSAFRKQKHRVALMVVGLGLASFLTAGFVTDFRFDIGLVGVLRQGTLGVLFVGASFFAFRKTLLQTRHNRRVFSFFMLMLASQNVHRVLALYDGTPVTDVLRTDAIFAIAFSAFAGIVLERWFFWQVALGVLYLATTFFWAPAVLPGFGAFLILSMALGIWFWREPTLREGDASTTSKSSGRSDRRPSS